MAKSTKANVPPPPRQRLMAEAPAPTMVPDNLSRSDNKLVDLNFKVSPDFHRMVKSLAATRGMTMKDLLEAAIKEYVNRYGDIPKETIDLFRRG